jgi:HlyD family secretion protein
MRNWRTWGAIAGIIVVAGAGVLALRMRGGASQAASFTQVVTVERGDLVAATSPTGELYAARQAELSFDVNKIPLVELHVVPGQQVQEGQVLARIDPASLQRAVDQATANLLSAQEALERAENPYTELDRQKAGLDVTQAEVALEEAEQALEELLNPDLVTAKNAVRQAEFNLESARLSLSLTRHSSTVGETVRDLEYSVAWHERELRNLQVQRQQNKVEQTTVDEEAEVLAEVRAQLEAAQASARATLDAAEDRVTQAEEALADAEERLTELQAGPDALVLAQARSRVAQAEYNLARAEDDLATILAGPDPKAVQLAQARHDADKATLEEAQATVEAATMVAPFDGTVISVGPEVGDLVSSNTNVVTLADLSDLEVLGMVDETDISQVEVGQQAEITFDAFPGRRFWGEVLEVPLEGRLMQNVVSYEVPVSLEGAEGVSLRPGMTANLRIVVGRRENVLLVSVLAVQQGEEGSVVQVQDTPQGPATATRVEVGLSDGVYVEVLRGLNEGDRVVVEYQSQEEPGALFRFGPMVHPPGGAEGMTR